MGKRVLVFDFGASSGRAMLAQIQNGRLHLQELHRFPNDPVQVGDTLYWDLLRLFHEVQQGILKAKGAGGFDCIGVDTWGADFGLLDRDGRLLENPVHCRDRRTDGIPERVLSLLSADDLYRRSGIQFNQFNTLYQLFALKERRPWVLEQAHRLLPMADLMVYLLTGLAAAEYTLATTTQLIDPCTRDWNRPLLRLLGLPEHIFPPVVQPGCASAPLSPDLCRSLGVPPVPVFSCCGHDTACAVAAVPTEEPVFAYISSGTWSLLGTECTGPVISEAGRKYNFTNEGGYGGTIRLLTNIMGLWLVQETRRQWQRDGTEHSFADLEGLARESPPFRALVDPNHPSLAFPGDLPERVRDFCLRTGQPVPECEGQIMRCLYESLALAYRAGLDHLVEVSGRQYPRLHIVGGGSKDRLLCQMTADACGLPVTAGPEEATAIGNALVCLSSLGEVNDLAACRRLVRESFSVQEYRPHPENNDAWACALQAFQTLCGTAGSI